MIFWGIHVVDHVFDDHFFHVYIKAEKADEGKLVKEFLIFRVCILEDLPGAFEAAHEIFFQVTDLGLLHAENFLVDVGHIFLSQGLEVLVCDRPEKSLDITDGKDIFKIVDKDQHQQMFPGIAFLLRRGKELVLGVVVDHGLGQDLVIFMALGGSEIFFHKSSDLIHVKIDVWDFVWFYIIKLSNFCKNAAHHFFFIFCHRIITSAPYYIVLNTTCKETFFREKEKMRLGFTGKKRHGSI